MFSKPREEKGQVELNLEIVQRGESYTETQLQQVYRRPPCTWMDGENQVIILDTKSQSILKS